MHADTLPITNLRSLMHDMNVRARAGLMWTVVGSITLHLLLANIEFGGSSFGFSAPALPSSDSTTTLRARIAEAPKPPAPVVSNNAELPPSTSRSVPTREPQPSIAKPIRTTVAVEPPPVNTTRVEFVETPSPPPTPPPTLSKLTEPAAATPPIRIEKQSPVAMPQPLQAMPALSFPDPVATPVVEVPRPLPAPPPVELPKAEAPKVEAPKLATTEPVRSEPPKAAPEPTKAVEPPKTAAAEPVRAAPTPVAATPAPSAAAVTPATPVAPPVAAAPTPTAAAPVAAAAATPATPTLTQASPSPLAAPAASAAASAAASPSGGAAAAAPAGGARAGATVTLPGRASDGSGAANAANAATPGAASSPNASGAPSLGSANALRPGFIDGFDPAAARAKIARDAARAMNAQRPNVPPSVAPSLTERERMAKNVQDAQLPDCSETAKGLGLFNIPVIVAGVVADKGCRMR